MQEERWQWRSNGKLAKVCGTLGTGKERTASLATEGSGGYLGEGPCGTQALSEASSLPPVTVSALADALLLFLSSGLSESGLEMGFGSVP